MSRMTAAVALLALLTAACTTSPVVAPWELGAPAEQLAQSSIVVDAHIDVPYRLQRSPADVSRTTSDGDFDYPRARAGGLNVAFMSIYTPAELEEKGEAFEFADRLIDGIEALVAASPNKFAIARNPSDARSQFEAGLISLPLGMENGAPIEGDIDKLVHFFQRGIRYITLTHSLSNHIADSSYDDNRRWNGLSEFGAEVVRNMNRLGIMVDVSHVSDEAFWDVLRISAVPVIASHSSARRFTPGFERNMSDEMIEALADNGGVIMINFGSSFLTEAANSYSSMRSDAEKIWKAGRPDLSDDEAEALHEAIWAEAHGPYPFADIADVLDHIDHVVGLVGVDHVGIGSDYDGVGDSLPSGLKDVATYPNLVAGLIERGYDAAAIRKILGENLLRVWEIVDAAASQS